MTTYNLSDAAPIAARRRTADGYLVATAKAARTGVQHYAGFEVGRPDLPVARIYRPESEVFDKHGSFSSLAHKPILLNHTTKRVTAENWKQHAVGHIGHEVVRDGEHVSIPLMVADATAIVAVDAGQRELSVGYTCRLEWTAGVTDTGEAYDAIQRDIRCNHVALVQRGRAGSECRIGDSHYTNFGKDNMNPIGIPMTFMDGIAPALAGQVGAILDDMASNDVARVERGRDAARSLSYTLLGATYGGDPAVVTDAQRATYREGADYLSTLVTHADRREGELRARWAGGDMSVNVGVTKAASQDAQARHHAQLGDAWKAPAATVTVDDVHQRVTDTRTPFERHRAGLRDAWKGEAA